jgi:PAS domain S-box-containing protein
MNCGMVLLDSEMKILYWNRWLEQNSGLSQRETVGRNMLEIFPEISESGQGRYLTNVLRKRVPVCLSPHFHQFFIRIQISGSSHTDYMRQQIKMFPVDLPEDNPSALIFIEDVTDAVNHERELNLVNQKLAAELEEKKVLLREVHHRVKNNLQIICSLIKRQMRSADHPLVDESLKESLNRVMSIALMHEQLYRSESLASIDFRELAVRMAQHLFALHAVSPQRIRFVYEGDIQPLVMEQALPCSLITNELLTNALKYAFPDNRDGYIRLVFRQQGDILEYEFSDNGAGGDQDILQASNTKTIGVYLIRLLAEKQLEAECNFTIENGTVFRMRFTQTEI